MQNAKLKMQKVLVAAVLASSMAVTLAAQAPQTPAPDVQLSPLAPANLAKPRPKPPFDLTGTWFIDLGSPNSWRFGPPPPANKLTPAAQVHFDAMKKAQAEGKVYRDDIGQCWPAGLPLIMTRVWPVGMIQMPTAIYMISHFMNSLRVIYLDGRPHSDPDVVVRTFNGESIGKWEGDTLVVDTTHFVNDHHWIDTGVIATDALHIVERIRLLKGGGVLEIEYTLTDPKSWEGEMKWTKRWNRVDDQEITEVECLPDLNSHIPSTQSKENVR
jgi:hypothetical protein